MNADALPQGSLDKVSQAKRASPGKDLKHNTQDSSLGALVWHRENREETIGSKTLG